MHDEVLGVVTTLLQTTPGISAAAYFGSVARRTQDDLSDIDLIVRCDARGSALFCARLDDRVGVQLYRPFSAGREPSGRYWFESSHPFLRLDVSFHVGPDYDRIVEFGDTFVRPPVLDVEVGGDEASVRAPVSPLPEWSSVAHDYAGALREYQEAAKSLLRGGRPKRPLSEEHARLMTFEDALLPPGAWSLSERSRAIVDDAGLS